MHNPGSPNGPTIIRSSDNDNTGFWPPRFAAYPGYRLAHLTKKSTFLCGLKFFDVANMVESLETVSVKDVSINNDALLNIQAC